MGTASLWGPATSHAPQSSDFKEPSLSGKGRCFLWVSAALEDACTAGLGLAWEVLFLIFRPQIALPAPCGFSLMKALRCSCSHL